MCAAMVLNLRQFDYLIEEQKTSKNDNNSTFPLFGFVDLSLYCTFFNKIHKFFLGLWLFLLCQLHSCKLNVKGQEQISKSEFSHKENESNGSIDDGKLERDEVKILMAKLGFFCSSESEELEENYGSKELSELFEEQEPSLDEVKQAFDVFDENKDGFIVAWELQRVLSILGLKEAAQLENCQKMIKNFDENQDGRIDFSEFVKIMENHFC
ncbi:probable calcium-binding protein CML45 [Abrus precatorius]|uniref:Probable calcium-binding protein CML45 n=1 Tax=Abrus precatorius TaxID=3816 RepID=A0A8B8LDS9_ABRPR|nr:probable calcium-binding protein CML45 [Abrus precatorius]